MDEFLGRPLAYWIEIDKDLKIKNTDELVLEERDGKIRFV